MKIKSGVWEWLAAACGCVGVLYGMGLEGNMQAGAPVSNTQVTAAFILVLLSLLFLRFGFAAQEREEREAKRRRYGKITRTHARNPEYPENQERGA